MSLDVKMQATRVLAYYSGDIRVAAQSVGVGYSQLGMAAAVGEATKATANKIQKHVDKLGISSTALDLKTLVHTFNLLDAMEETPDINVAKAQVAVGIVRTAKAVGIFGREIPLG